MTDSRIEDSVELNSRSAPVRMDSGDWLLVLDTPGLQSYVFESQKLVDIVGASGLLVALCDALESRARSILSEAGGELERVHLAGGGGQLILKSVPRSVAERVGRALQGEARERSAGGLNLVFGLTGLGAEGYGGALGRAYASLRDAKNELRPRCTLSTGFERSCDGCSKRPATAVQDERLLCAICHRRWEFGREFSRYQHFSGFADFLEQKTGARAEPPADLSRIAPNIAIIYGDGNGLGAIVRNLRDTESMRRFSEGLESAMSRSVWRALFEAGLALGSRARCQILLLGGDDLVLAVPDWAAVRVCESLAQFFEEETRNLVTSLGDANQRLSLSLGVAVGPASSPTRILVEQASWLLDNAKATAWRREKSGTFIDWHDSRREGIDIESLRARWMTRHGERRELNLTARPYALKDFSELAGKARRLARAESSRGRREALSGLLERGYMGARAELRHQVGRMRPQARSALGELFPEGWETAPWRSQGDGRFDSQLMDLIELCDWVSAERPARTDAH